ncbi:hypothetical protein [Haladaptatus sp. DYF46]|uniref:hypothetical protein n=1 Tax=Haladaptatus sp. DYF46 TaxID=2886041 RepID=UPI001E633C79|nr:hypothetical protein [Haladaptatus sp. DYF46]
MVQNEETLAESEAHEQALDCTDAAMDAAASEVGATIRTGPTETNVNDVVVVLIGNRDRAGQRSELFGDHWISKGTDFLDFSLDGLSRL